MTTSPILAFSLRLSPTYYVWSERKRRGISSKTGACSVIECMNCLRYNNAVTESWLFMNILYWSVNKMTHTIQPGFRLCSEVPRLKDFDVFLWKFWHYFAVYRLLRLQRLRIFVLFSQSTLNFFWRCPQKSLTALLLDRLFVMIIY